MRDRPVYLDHHATTPCDARVVEAMLPYLTEHFGNASSVKHSYGKKASDAVLRARIQVARLLGASPKEVVFTSGATEALNLALKGLFAMHPERRHLVTLPTEHKAVLDCAKALAREGVETTLVPVDDAGRVSMDALAKAIRPDTLAVCIMASNNEVGTVHPVEAIGELCADRGVFFVCDATQSAGKVPLNVRKARIHLCAVSAHKMYGPKGIGALLVRSREPRVRLRPLMDGGSHEQGMRSGTLNVPGIVGFGEACEVAAAEMGAEAKRLAELRDQLLGQLSAGIPDLRLNGVLDDRLPHNLNVSLPGVAGEDLLDALRPHIAVSSGSACSTDSTKPSHVLKAMGVPDALAYSSLRFGLGRSTTAEDINVAAQTVVAAAHKLKR